MPNDSDGMQQQDGQPLHVCDVAGCEQGFATTAEVVAHEQTHQRPPSGAELIRATHPYGFRSGEWARLITTMTDPDTGRECYLVRFPDDVTDFWPVEDPCDPYEFSDGGYRRA